VAESEGTGRIRTEENREKDAGNNLKYFVGCQVMSHAVFLPGQVLRMLRPCAPADARVGAQAWPVPSAGVGTTQGRGRVHPEGERTHWDHQDLWCTSHLPHL
jgi:hypothetical protein